MTQVRAAARAFLLVLASLVAAVLVIDGPGAEAAPRPAAAPASQAPTCPGGSADRSEVEEQYQARRVCRPRLSTAAPEHLTERSAADSALARLMLAGRSDVAPRERAGKRSGAGSFQASLQVFRC
ncbi:hypothetical protein GCM10010406_43140 [Streptomyces thermolineatus]|uniref:Secreted protein n=1 Tax=Streptomyces thermolineatus TaxID=44033 RepID=A0ABP5ZPF3_9ACTN